MGTSSSVTLPSSAIATTRSSGWRAIERISPALGTLTLIRLSASLNLLPTIKKMTSKNTTSIIGVKLMVASSVGCRLAMIDRWGVVAELAKSFGSAWLAESLGDFRYGQIGESG